MRKLMWFAVGFAAACAAAVWLLPDALIPYSVAACGIAAAVLLALIRRHERIRIVAVLMLGLTVGQLWFYAYTHVYLSAAMFVDGKTVNTEIVATDFSFQTEYGETVDGYVTLGDKTYRVRTYLHTGEAVSPGDTLSGNFRFRYTAPSETGEATYHGGNGIFLLAYQKDEPQITLQQDLDLQYLPAYMRQHILKTIDMAIPADAAAFAKALLLGDTSELSYEVETDLTVSGIRHIVAVSGLHISILFSALYFITGRRRIFTAVLGVPVLVIFAAMAGFSMSVMRACFMQLLMILALLFKKEYDPPTALGFAALMILLINPLAITSVGFQLSVASVAGIFLFSGRILGWLTNRIRIPKGKGIKPRLIRMITSSVAITLGAMVTTTPLTAWYFGAVSLVSAVTNLLCMWVVSFLFCGIIVTCIVGSLWLPAGAAIGWVLAWLVRYILTVADILSRIPCAAVYTQNNAVVIWLILCYALLVVFLIAKGKRPLRLLCCSVLSLFAVLLYSWITPTLDNYRVSILDVGQGQCVLLQSAGKTYMVDCGGDYDEDAADTAAAALLSQGITRLDGLILSHYDRDHVGGAAHLLSRIDADVLLLPQGEDAAQWDEAMLAVSNGTPIRVWQDMQITWEDACITVFPSVSTENSNESSLCVLFQTEKCDILITGDRSISGEHTLVQSAYLPQLDVLIVGHHGAASSTGELLLQATRPEIAVISVGEGNGYGHPAQSVLTRLLEYGCEIRRTDLEGTIIIRG